MFFPFWTLDISSHYFAVNDTSVLLVICRWSVPPHQTQKSSTQNKIHPKIEKNVKREDRLFDMLWIQKLDKC